MLGCTRQELQRAIRDGVDARRLVQRQGSAGAGAEPRRRLLHQHGRSWRTVDTDDMHETSRRDRHGQLLTESAHTHQREEFHDMQVRRGVVRGSGGGVVRWSGGGVAATWEVVGVVPG